jgi:hypothetical protein
MVQRNTRFDWRVERLALLDQPLGWSFVVVVVVDIIRFAFSENRYAGDVYGLRKLRKAGVRALPARLLYAGLRRAQFGEGFSSHANPAMQNTALCRRRNRT